MDISVFCGRPFTRCRVTATGQVAFCCYQRCDPLQPTWEPYIGNVLEAETFDDVWFSNKAEAIRQAVLSGSLHESCQCPGCPYTSERPPFPKKPLVYNEYPTFLEIDLPNTHCNIGLENPGPDHPACIMCERAAPFFQPEENHLEEVLRKIKHIVPNLQQIHVQGIAEPFYKNLLFDVLTWLEFEKYKYNCLVSITTNATIFGQQTRSEYFRRCPHSITNVSLDAATPETYQAIRILPAFDKVVENFYAFDRERAVARQFLRLLCNVNLLNINEVLGIVDIAHKGHVNYVEFFPTDGFNHKIIVNETNCGLFAKAQRDIIERCKALKVPHTFTRPLDLNLTKRLVELAL